MGQSTRAFNDHKLHQKRFQRKLLWRKKDQFRNRKFERKLASEEACEKTYSRLEQQLLAMRRHFVVGGDLLTVSNDLGGTRVGSGVEIENVLPSINFYRSQVNELLKIVMFDKSGQIFNDLQHRADAMVKEVESFMGQVMVLPLSLQVFTDAKVKDCRVVIDYGGKLTSILGTHFSGRCSRILLPIHPESIPKISLAYRRSVMGIFLKEKILGQVRHSRIVNVGPDGADRACVELLFTEDQVGDMQITARALLQIEWFPNIVGVSY